MAEVVVVTLRVPGDASRMKRWVCPSPGCTQTSTAGPAVTVAVCPVHGVAMVTDLYADRREQIRIERGKSRTR